MSRQSAVFPEPSSPPSGVSNPTDTQKGSEYEEDPGCCARCCPCCPICHKRSGKKSDGTASAFGKAIGDCCNLYCCGSWYWTADGELEYSNGLLCQEKCCNCPNPGDSMQHPCDCAGYCQWLSKVCALAGCAGRKHHVAWHFVLNSPLTSEIVWFVDVWQTFLEEPTNHPSPGCRSRTAKGSGGQSALVRA